MIKTHKYAQSSKERTTPKPERMKYKILIYLVNIFKEIKQATRKKIGFSQELKRKDREILAKFMYYPEKRNLNQHFKLFHSSCQNHFYKVKETCYLTIISLNSIYLTPFILVPCSPHTV